MESLISALEFVNAQHDFHAKKAALFATSSPRRAEQHTKVMLRFEDLRAFLEHQAEELERLRSEKPPNAISGAGAVPRQLALRLEDIDGLPDELIQELSITDGDRMDFTIQAIMNEADGVCSLDQLLVGLYRRTGEVHKRSNLNARLYRMASKGDLFSVPGRKGVYSTRELSPDDAAKLS